MKITILLMLLVGLFSCHDYLEPSEANLSDGQAYHHKMLSIHKIDEDLGNIYQAFKIFSLGQISEDQREIIKEVRIVNNNTFVLTRLEPSATYNFRILDSQGSLLKSVDLPKDLSHITGLDVLADEHLIVFGDTENGSLLFYDQNGVFIKREVLEESFIDFEFLDKTGQWVFHSLTFDGSAVHNVVNFYNKSFEKIGAHQFKNESFAEKEPQGSANSLEIIDEGRVLFANIGEHTLYELTPTEKRLLFDLNATIFGNQVLHEYHSTNQLLWTRAQLFNRYYSILRLLDTEETYFIHNSMLANNFNGDFAFVFKAPDFVSGDQFISKIPKKTMDLVLDNLSSLESGNKVKSQIDREAANFLLVYQFDLAFFERNATEDFSEIMPEE